MQLIAEEIARHLPQKGEARRVFHGRGRCFPGYQDLVIDSYGALTWVTLFAERTSAWCLQLSSLLRQVLPECRCVVLQRRDLVQNPLEVIYGELPPSPMADEEGLKYFLRPETGQNVGFFIDMAAGRSLIRRISAGKKILNLFAYTCSFSVAALAGGARQVVNVDMNRGALEFGKKNHLLNALDLRTAHFLPHEIFRSFGLLKKHGPFDLIICDPPFSQGRNFTAETHWSKLIARLPSLLAADGEVLACLNAPHLSGDFLRNLFSEQIPSSLELQCLGPGRDFPVSDSARALSIHHFRIDQQKTG